MIGELVMLLSIQASSIPADAEPTGDLMWLVLVIAALATLVCVGIHYETLRLIITFLRRRGDIRRVRSMLVVVMLVLLFAHLIEAAIFAGAYHIIFALHDESTGRLVGPYDGGFADTLYFSLSVYTTVGFGDIAPEGPVRLMVGVEALAGLVLITWSASFTFLIMQRIFAKEFSPDRGEA